MAKPIIFIKDFFCTEDWYQLYKRPKWLQEFCVSTIRGEVRLRISKDRLYVLFQSYMKDFYNGSRCQDISSFYRGLEKIGLTLNPKRLMIGGPTGVKRNCVDLYFKQFKKIMEGLYKGIAIQRWEHVENYQNFVKK